MPCIGWVIIGENRMRLRNQNDLNILGAQVFNSLVKLITVEPSLDKQVDIVLIFPPLCIYLKIPYTAENVLQVKGKSNACVSNSCAQWYITQFRILRVFVLYKLLFGKETKTCFEV